MALPDFRINPYVQAPVQGLSQEYGQLMDQKILDYDTNLAAVDMWSEQNARLKESIGPFAKDQAAASRIMGETRGQLDEIAANGDYENVGRQVRKGASQFVQKVQPLIQNQQKYQNYNTELQELFKAGKIGHDTMAKARQASLKGYEGIDESNPQGTMFTGFVPSPDISIADKAVKFAADWKANGGTKFYKQPDGSTKQVDIETSDPQEIKNAIEYYLRGDNEYKNYFQTQYSIGNEGRVNQEKADAIEAAAAKAGYTKTKTRVIWDPQDIRDEKKTLDLLNKLQAAPSATSINPYAKNIFDQPGMEYNEATGKMRFSSMVEYKDGKYYQYTAPDGTAISAAEYAAAGSAAAGSQAFMAPDFSGKTPQERAGFSKKEISEQEADKYVGDYNSTLLDMAAERKLRVDLEEAGKIKDPVARQERQDYLYDVMSDTEKSAAYLEAHKAEYTDPKFITETKKKYDQAIKNSGVLTGNNTWQIATVPGSPTPEITGIKDDDILAGTAGKKVGIMSLDPAFKSFIGAGQQVDLNATIEEIQKTYSDYVYKGVRRVGPMQQNPFDNVQPGMEYSIILEQKDTKQPKLINFAATINDRELQPLNQVKSMGSIGKGGTVWFDLPATADGSPMNGYFNVRSGTQIVDGKEVFSNYVEILGPDKQKIYDDSPGFRQDIPMSEFAEHYKQFYAPKVLEKYASHKLK